MGREQEAAALSLTDHISRGQKVELAVAVGVGNQAVGTERKAGRNKEQGLWNWGAGGTEPAKGSKFPWHRHRRMSGDKNSLKVWN